ncbi:hypothetical protein SAMN06298216_0565 [Spirosomataceae bacterium TFI 002]|nr:hypothetical protein SAMN06298216_0565 [Spirosomataceae bacterium TFI 002]
MKTPTLPYNWINTTAPKNIFGVKSLQVNVFH